MKTFAYLLILAAVSFGAKLGYRHFTAVKCEPPPGIECGSLAHLRHLAREESARLPRQIDAETRLNRIWAREGEIVYDAQLVNYGVQDIDQPKFEREAHLRMRDEFCRSREARLFRQHQLVATFQVTGRDGFNIATISLSPADCR